MSVVKLRLPLILVFFLASSPAHACGFDPIAEHVLLRPKPRTFYSEDALNPDVVRHRGRYAMFFSGNPVESAHGTWRTGLATAKHPWGPFRVKGLRGKFFNGGTAVVNGRLRHLTTTWDSGTALLSSRTGSSWRRVSLLPASKQPWRGTDADFFLDQHYKGRLDAYFLARPAGSEWYGAIARAHYRKGRWYGFDRIINPTSELIDLGEPAVFRARGHTYLLYVGMKPNGGARNIYLARQKGRKWVSCGRQPFITASRAWYRQNAIDPSPLIVGRHLYVYFGGGTLPSIGAGMDGTIGVRVFRL